MLLNCHSAYLFRLVQASNAETESGKTSELANIPPAMQFWRLKVKDQGHVQSRNDAYNGQASCHWEISFQHTTVNFILRLLFAFVEHLKVA